MKLKVSYVWWIEEKDKFYSITWSATLFELINKTEKNITRVLIDYWAFQWNKREKSRNKEILVNDVENIDAIIVTHAHLDHIWRIPYLVKNWFKWNIYMTEITKKLACLNWKDTISISKSDKNKSAHFKKKMRCYNTIKNISEKLKKNNLKKYEKWKLRKKLEALLSKNNITIDKVICELDKYEINNVKDIDNIKNINLLFDENDLEETLKHIVTVNLEEEIKINNFLSFKFFDAAHIEWSIMPYLIFSDWYWKKYNCLIAQDLWRLYSNPLDWNITFPKEKIDYLQLETTYAGREHPEMKFSINKFIKSIQEHNWPILIPAFSIQRTQFILKILLENYQKLWNKKIYTTSELSQQVSKVFLDYNFEKYKYLLDKRVKFLLPWERLWKNKFDKSIIIWSSWMLQWWSIENRLWLFVTNPNAKIIFTGYQWDWTRWSEIVNWKEYIVVNWEAMKIKCSYEYIKWFSSHADNNDLINFLHNFRPNNFSKIKLSLTHWWDNRYLLENEILKNKKLRKIKKKYEILIPKIMDVFEFKF